MKRIIICGFPRSGTSLLSTLLSNSIKKISYHNDEISALNFNGNNNLVLTKRPLDCTIIDKIKVRYPDDELKIIFCIRDPRDLICSVHKNIPYDYFIGFQNCYFVGKSNMLSHPGIDLICSHWEKLIEKKIDILTIKYEELTRDTLQTANKIEGYIKEKIHKRSFDINKKTIFPKGLLAAIGNNKEGIHTNSIGQWKKHPRRVFSEFIRHPHMHNIMKSMGYEENNKWFFEIFGNLIPKSKEF